MKRLMALLLCMVLLAAACNKEEEKQAFITIINASPDAPPLSLLVNGNPVIQQSSTVSGNYRKVPAGNVAVQVSAAAGGNALYTTNTNLSENKYYTVIMADSLKWIKGSLVMDDLTRPAGNNVGVRFLHMVPYAPAVDVVSGGQKIFTSRSFNDQSANVANAGFKTLALTATGTTPKLDVYRAGTPDSLGSIPAIATQAGKLVTVVVRPSLKPDNTPGFTAAIAVY